MSLSAARVEVMRLRPTLLPDFTTTRRQPTRPVEARDGNFDAKFDSETLFYDCFIGIRGRIVLVGPPFLNLKDALQAATIVANPSGHACSFELRELDRHGQLHVDAPEGTRSLVITSALGDVTIDVQPSEVDIFAGRRVMFTQSRNNDLRWIQDWVRFSRDIHGADAVLIYDNGSTRYTPQDLADAIGTLDGIAAVRVVDWPFKFGPQGIDARRYWDSDFGQHGVWEHARRRLLEAAASVQGSDVDELVLTTNGRSLFDIAETSATGVLRYEGRWVIGLEGREPPPARPGRRHIDYTVVRKERLETRFGVVKVDADRCPPKWTLVPHRIKDRQQWKIHSIGGHLGSRLVTREVSYRHFREISDSWKYERMGREAFDPARHEDDAEMQALVQRVNWDR
ncbi:hypothetical protein E8L99_23620 [Phreatobacter aquaticus]|uniref:Uncharacterized protein n=1 Tax=Phreatobacter aquaticus TaxID=2570229 RepID=A0A4D7QRC6_9HYPH|nr:hypothetical protein [Phreatobacter aquaticus]QCK88533.1 hypothetical protein E8L99_23620 [Phreatobacter aquaticus]